MNARTKAIANVLINCLSAVAVGIMGAVSTGDGPNAFHRPFVWASIVAAILPVLRATVNDNPMDHP